MEPIKSNDEYVKATKDAFLKKIALSPDNTYRTKERYTQHDPTTVEDALSRSQSLKNMHDNNSPNNPTVSSQEEQYNRPTRSPQPTGASSALQEGKPLPGEQLGHSLGGDATPTLEGQLNGTGDVVPPNQSQMTPLMKIIREKNPNKYKPIISKDQKRK